MQYQTKYPYGTTAQQYGGTSHPREEQRRRQQEYSQALAQQVAQREQQKRRERENDHSYGRNNANNFQNQPAFEQSRPQAFEPAESGMFSGLGRNNQNSRTSFARGQAQLHHRLPGGPELVNYPQASGFPPTGVSYSGQALQPNFPPAQHQLPVDNRRFSNGCGSSAVPNHQQSVPQQNWQQQPAHDPSGLGSNMQGGWPPQQNSMSQARTSQFWPGQNQPIVEQAAPPPSFGGYGSPQRVAQQNGQQGFPQAEPTHNGGRRQRTDIHDGNSGEAERFQRKLQQQQEMQTALERQIEEKRQQKLEAKRRQEEEDRREMERFEEDKRRQRAEEERIQEEKRRKAEIERQKAEQQQKLHAQVSQAQPQHAQPFHQPQLPPQPEEFSNAQNNQAQFQHPQPFHQQEFAPQQPEHFSNAPPPSNLKNPFTNSRAHLFEDPPQHSPQRGSIAPNNQFGYSNQNSSPVRANPQGAGHVFPHENNSVGRLLDPTELRRQYDDMRNELSKQKQLVDQLRQAQVQIQHQQQQHSPKREESGNIPTLMDLEKLRNELRGELAYREEIHRQELESLKREQQHERSPVYSPHRYPDAKHSLDRPIRDAPNNVERAPSYPANNKRLEEASTAFEPQRQLRSSTNNFERHAQSIDRLARLLETPLDESLRGDSKLVYFDGRVNAGKAGKTVVSQATKWAKEDEDQSESFKLEPSKVRTSLHRSPTKQHGVNQSVVAMSSLSPTKSRTSVQNVSVDESHEFVVAGISSSPLHKQHQNLLASATSHPNTATASSHRYSQIPSVLSKKSCKWRLESMGTHDSDSEDDLDASLDGEQLEALFQRNVRRHEILVGFQSKVRQDSNQLESGGAPHGKQAWTELRQKLESNRFASARRKLSTTSTDSNDSTPEQQNNAEDEAALVASSQWMSSTNHLELAR